jgi:hypothetical protein
MSSFRTKPNEFDRLCDLYGTDKGGDGGRYRHGYSITYDLLFRLFRYKAINLFECGIGSKKVDSFTKTQGVSGASLRVWQDYFPNAHIYGADIDKDLLFTDERITTVELDQTNEQSISTALSGLGVSFDIVIDDGLHRFAAGKSLFLGMQPFLSKQYIYVIEDVALRDVYNYKKFFDSENLNYSIVDYNTQINSATNHRLIVVTG